MIRPVFPKPKSMSDRRLASATQRAKPARSSLVAMNSTRRRARQACQTCNARRVRCDVVDRVPCSKCAEANIPCLLRPSRRGKHPRHSRSGPWPPPGLTSHAAHQQTPTTTEGPDESACPAPSVSPTNRPGQLEPSAIRATPATPSSHLSESGHGRSGSPNNAAAVLAERQDPAEQDVEAHTKPGVGDDDGLDRRPGEVDQPLDLSTLAREEDSAAFLGESTSIQYLNDDSTPAHTGPSSSHSSLRLLHPVPSAVKAENLVPQWEAERKRARISRLHEEGIFSFPSKPAVRGLLKAYFKWFHPCFPMLDEDNIWSQYHDGTLSPLLLQAILFNAIVHCGDDVVDMVGLGPRHVARYVLFNRVKDIYDVDFEPKKLLVIQTLFLMSFWRTGALMEKDTRHWLGAALSLAQTAGLHRSSQRVDARTGELRRRLWWSIYVRERQCAAALGLPNRIRDEDCDVEPLTTADFKSAFDPSTPPGMVQKYVTYFVGMAYLAQTLGTIIHSGYLPGRTSTAAEKARIKADLVTWHRGLPKEARNDMNDFDARPDFFSNMLNLAWNNLFILLFRAGCLPGGQDVDGDVAVQAAIRNSRTIEEMLLDDQIKHAQIHVITNIFNTLCIHAVGLRTARGSQRSVAEHWAKLCLLGLQELQKTWEVRNWILQLFFQYLDRPTADRLRTSDEDVPVASGARVGPAHLSLPGTPQQLTTVTNDRGEMEDFLASDTPWTWCTQEAHQLLFAQLEDQIQNDFAFGEGGIPLWSFEGS